MALDPLAGLHAISTIPSHGGSSTGAWSASGGWGASAGGWGWSGGGGLGTFTPTRSTYTPAGAPERFNLNAPFSSSPSPSALGEPPPASATQGDWLGSFQQSVADLLGSGGQNFNLGNVIPRLLEVPTVLARNFADAAVGGVVGLVAGKQAGETAGDIARVPFDTYLNGLKAYSDITAPLFEALPNWYRDSRLGDMAKVYRSIVSGKPMDLGPLGINAFMMTHELVPSGPGGSAADIAQGWSTVAAMVAGPDQQKQRDFLLNAVDLPASVKDAIRRNPGASDDELTKLLDSAPEGRQWTYAQELPGVIRSFVTPAIIYGGEYIGAYRTAGWLGRQAGLAGLPTQIPSGVPLIGGRGALSLAGRIQTGLAAAGAATLPLTAVAEGIGRTWGNQAVVDFANTVYNTHPISDDPHVQLMTSFAVNPFAAAGLARRGVLRLAYGAGDITVGKVLGVKLARLYTQDDLLHATIGKMYNIRPDAAPAFIAKWYVSKGEAIDSIVELAADDVMSRLPTETRINLQHGFTDPIARAKNVLRLYAPRIIDTIQNHPERLAVRFQETAWNYHNYRGTFDAEIAAKNGLDYREFKRLTYGARQQMEAVAGYIDVLHPTAAADIRASLDTAGGALKPNLADTVPVAVVNGFIEKYPALRNYLGQTYKPGETLTKGNILEGLDLAERDYRALARKNPVRATTGSDPILRPNATNAEWAAAVGTDERTIVAMETPSPANAEILRPFLAERAGMDPSALAAMSPEDIRALAADHVSTAAAPWLAQGERVAQAEAEAARLTARYRELQLAEPHGDTPAGLEAAAISRQMAALDELIGTAKDPITPYSAQVKFAKAEVRASRARRDLLAKAERKTAAQATLDELAALEDQAQALVGGFPHGQPEKVAAYQSRVRAAGREAVKAGKSKEEIKAAQERVADPTKDYGGSWRGLVGKTPQDVWAWTGGLPRVPAGIVVRLEDTLRGSSRGGLANTLAAMGNEDLWAVVSQHYQPGTRFYASLSATERRMVEKVMGGRPITHTLGEVASTAGMEPDALVKTLGQLAERYDTLLDGTSAYAVRRTAEIIVPSEAVAEASARSLVFDPIFEVIDHPKNLDELRVALAAGDHAVAAKIVERDPILYDQAKQMAEAAGRSTEEFVLDPVNSAELAKLAPERATPLGQAIARTPLDQAVLGGDHPAVAQIVDQLNLIEGRMTPHPPIKDVPLGVAERIMSRPNGRPSTKFLRQMDTVGVDLQSRADPAILADPANAIGRDVLSVLNRSDFGPGMEPHTIGGVVELLREIENGNATNLGFGPEALAKGQALANRLLEHSIHATARAGFVPGMFGPGVDSRLVSIDALPYLRKMLNQGEIVSDPLDPIGLQYGFKKAPKDSVTWEFEEARRVAEETGVPGLGEEFLTGHFQPFEERLGTARIRQAYNRLFGPLHNIDIAVKAQAEFTRRAAQLGVAAEDAKAIWDGWRQTSVESRGAMLKRLTGGRITTVEGKSALYATPRNIPNGVLQRTAERALTDQYPKGGMPGHYGTIDYSHLFRQASSFTLRSLEDSGWTLGQKLGAAYGKVTTNDWVTFAYYQFRFGLDVRFHAMNYLEPFFLYAGRAGLLPENRAGLRPYLSRTEDYVRALSDNPMLDTGFPFMRSRDNWIYRTFHKEQPGALTSRLKGLQSEDPALMRQAQLELAQFDPELSKTIKMMGDTPESWLKAMDEWYGKVMNASSIDELLAQNFAEEIGRSPALAEVYGQLEAVNRRAWSDVQATFFGNPARSQVERSLNSYLLYWPLSYQIKATKWLMRILFDRAGGLKTNAAGAYALNEVMKVHNEHLLNDPEYAAWFEEHPTLVFLAQMLVPITWDSVGVSLSPPLRSLFFGRSKPFWDIGPVYTFTEMGPKLLGELYPSVRDMPGANAIMRTLGYKPPEGPVSPVDQLIGDVSRFGQ